MTANLKKKSMNPHGCVEMWKCDFPIISLTSSPLWHVPFCCKKEHVKSIADYYFQRVNVLNACHNLGLLWINKYL